DLLQQRCEHQNQRSRGGSRATTWQPAAIGARRGKSRRSASGAHAKAGSTDHASTGSKESIGFELYAAGAAASPGGKDEPGIRSFSNWQWCCCRRGRVGGEPFVKHPKHTLAKTPL